MQISAASAMHIARAYQAQQAGAARPVAPTSPTEHTAPSQPAQALPAITPTQFSGAPPAPASANTTTGITAPNQAMLSGNVDAIVGGRVTRPIEFSGMPQPPGRIGPALSMYTRAADRIEAGTSLHIGRAIDMRG